ncbi:hypothetical protein SAMN05444000_12522 [Shimia gijangensis]|uniref:Uncharacterized protein n=1 Tax=Shimia gijangensis TaxID=1470563 RepID=A0A1M6RFD2_9RHOB|nr:hypothetical protein [Shimia gijangensis]SHK31169.1 hypothetical protein SAMN05444000_12522 [Shimia gijangensis]
MSILFDKMTPTAREIAEEKLRNEGILAPDAPLEYAFEVRPAELEALEKARLKFDHQIADCGSKDHQKIAELAIAKARCVSDYIAEMAG